MSSKFLFKFSFAFFVGVVLSLVSFSAHAWDVDYVTGGSINLGYGLSDIQYRHSNKTRDHAEYLSFGGPSIKLSFPDIDFTATASFFPSVRWIGNVDPGTNSLGVVLGFGPSFGYKNWLVSLPVYFPTPTQTDVAIAVGYRL